MASARHAPSAAAPQPSPHGHPAHASVKTCLPARPASPPAQGRVCASLRQSGHIARQAPAARAHVPHAPPWFPSRTHSPPPAALNPSLGTAADGTLPHAAAPATAATAATSTAAWVILAAATTAKRVSPRRPRGAASDPSAPPPPAAVDDVVTTASAIAVNATAIIATAAAAAVTAVAHDTAPTAAVAGHCLDGGVTDPPDTGTPRGCPPLRLPAWRVAAAAAVGARGAGFPGRVAAVPPSRTGLTMTAARVALAGRGGGRGAGGVCLGVVGGRGSQGGNRNSGWRQGGLGCIGEGDGGRCRAVGGGTRQEGASQRSGGQRAGKEGPGDGQGWVHKEWGEGKTKQGSSPGRHRK